MTLSVKENDKNIFPGNGRSVADLMSFYMNFENSPIRRRYNAKIF